MILIEDGVTVKYQSGINLRSFPLLQYVTILMPQTGPWHFQLTSGIK